MVKIQYKDQIGFENKRLENEIHSRMAAYRSLAGGSDLTLMHGWVIRYLYKNRDKEVFQRDIEAEFSIARSTATGVLKLMEKKGYIRRISVERDARLKKLELTELGIKMEEGTIANINKIETMLRQNISEEELEIFFRVIKKMRSNIEMKEGETNRRRQV